MHTFHTHSDQDDAEAAGGAGGQEQKEIFFSAPKENADRRAPPARNTEQMRRE